MKIRTTFTVFVSAVFLTILMIGCLPSVHPLYTDDDLIFREELLGTWLGPSTGFNRTDETETWKFEQDDEKTYTLTHITESDTTYFLGHLVQLGDMYFLDLILENADQLSNFAQYHIFPVHTFSKVTFNESQVSLEMFNSNWIIDMIDENRIRIKHEKASDLILLTASTEELQKFILKYGEEKKSYSEPIVLKRVIQS